MEERNEEDREKGAASYTRKNAMERDGGRQAR